MSLKLKILQDISAFSYEYKIKEILACLIAEMTTLAKKIHLNKIGIQSGITTDTVLLIKCMVEVYFKNSPYMIPISILIPKNFPSIAPDIFIDKPQGFEVNFKNTDIDPKSLRISVNSLKYWNSNNPSLLVPVQQVVSSFSAIFPIYRISSNSNKDIANLTQDQSQINFQNTMKGKLPPQNIPNHNQNLGHPQFQNYQNESVNYNNVRNPNENPINQNFNTTNLLQTIESEYKIVQNLDVDEISVRRMIIEEIRNKIESKIREEHKKIKQHEDKLNNYKNEFKTQNEKLLNLITNEENIHNETKEYLENLEKSIEKTRNYISEFKRNQNDTINFDSYIDISSVQLIQLIAMESTIEETISLLRRLIERAPDLFQTILRNIRSLTRELFKIKYSKEKLVFLLKK